MSERAPGLLGDDGYDYDDDDRMCIFLQCTDLSSGLPLVIRLLEEDRLHGNDLAKAATVGVYELSAAESREFRAVYPHQNGDVLRPRS